jgi:hydroxymethylpyrimidine pyrophosphatase-like HAD family hydrolase
MPVRLVAFDLDGTLLGGDDRLSPRTVDMLARARRAGITLVAATGRSTLAARLALGRTDAIDHIISSNGAVHYDVRLDRVVAHHPIEPGLLAALYKRVNAGLDGVCWAWESPAGIVPDCGFRALTARLDELSATAAGAAISLGRAAATSVKTVPRTVAQAMRLPPSIPASKAMIAHPYLVSDRLLGRLKGCLPKRLSAASSSAVFVEVTAPGIDKAFGLQALCRQVGVDRGEVMAFGDQLNDLSMLRWAGRGVAMANAHPLVLEAVVERAGRNVDDGVAAVVETLLPRA